MLVERAEKFERNLKALMEHMEMDEWNRGENVCRE